MRASRYAPTTPAQDSAQSRSDRLKRDKDRASRLLLRLRWKADLLWESYRKAMEIIRIQVGRDHTSERDVGSKQAESMFKVDFFEFYTLLERFITDCLAVLGFHVSAAAPTNNVNILRYITNPDLHRTRPLATHAFHANLLDALDDQNCPLHKSLGVQEVQVQLRDAKEFRNICKDADSNLQSGAKKSDPRNRELKDLQLETMLKTIIFGCEQAHSTVQEFEIVATAGSGPASYESSHADMMDVPFEYMEDAMDLD